MKSLLIFFVLLLPQFLVAQEVEMADAFRADGKIYVVVGVVLLILFGMIGYLFFVEKRVKKLEEEKGK